MSTRSGEYSGPTWWPLTLLRDQEQPGVRRVTIVWLAGSILAILLGILEARLNWSGFGVDVGGTTVGLTVYPMGTCSPAWMKGTFSVATPLTIPDGGAAITQSVQVTGLASVPEDLIVHLDVDHPRKTDLYIVLTQPSSGESLIWDVDSSGEAHVTVGSNLERDSEVNGTWTLSVRDVFPGSSGTLRGWSLELTSRRHCARRWLAGEELLDGCVLGPCRYLLGLSHPDDCANLAV